MGRKRSSSAVWIGGATDHLTGTSDQVVGLLVGKRGIWFSGNLDSSSVQHEAKVGHLCELLAWVEVEPQVMHLGDWLTQLFVKWLVLAHKAQVSCSLHFTHMWPNCWHLLQQSGSWMSLMTVI